MRSLLLFLFGGLLSNLLGKDLLVDPKGGDDEIAKQDPAMPWRTVSAAFLHSEPGDNIVLVADTAEEVRLMAANVGQMANEGFRTITSVAGKMKVGSILISQNDHTVYEDRSGTFDINLRLENIHVTGPSKIYGARNLEFKNCKFTFEESLLNGSDDIINRVSLSIVTGSEIEIDECEFTQTTIALEISGRDIEVRNCRIHHISHDGIRVAGARQLLIENTLIENLDDGADDPNTNQGDSVGPQEGWSKHCDAIHFFTSRGGTAGVTVRNCTFKSIESQAIQFNNLLDREHSDVLFENNIFYPTQMCSMRRKERVTCITLL